jgi:hypothetical protein
MIAFCIISWCFIGIGLTFLAFYVIEDEEITIGDLIYYIFGAIIGIFALFWVIFALIDKYDISSIILVHKKKKYNLNS